MSVSHGHSTIGGIEYGGCGEDKKKEIVSHQLGVSKQKFNIDIKTIILLAY